MTSGRPIPDARRSVADEDAWPFNLDSPVIAGALRPGRPLALMLVDLTGLDWPEVEPLLPVAREVAQEQGMVPVLVVDMLRFGGLRTAGFAYDVLPNAAANAPFAPDDDWASYLAHRRTLLVAKWQPAAIVHLGRHAEWPS
ncbi:hypothetical protein LAZ40_12285 [Cereibacter sphaeroides]|uniref:hypothetical protein n=1 Tax=Cereibacter sphaeroides TaxID=1063 RepID=UPI001F1CC44A|nr:hypothetical protein [Cereibacter sphaeroides]MCE6959800.1 hypothetical protein [Cereibacter sphaeroides]MCE6968732.1 hypothetical protein [Cereibacter sphaeroides]MCE6974654.1 hypothetical protein [Cereibacter sphaeroides]